jgi:recombination protein RecR
MAGNNQGYTESVRRLMELFGKLPGVGTRSAERMAFHILKSNPADALALADAIRSVKENVRHCSICYNLTEADPCNICQDASRDHAVVCVVEQPKDLLQLESTGIYKGVYHVLLGRLAPLEGIGPGELTIGHLLERIRTSHTEGHTPIREIILATNPTLEGDGTSLYLQNELAATNVQITRLARGLPAGAQIEYSNKAILADALTGRTKV